MLLLLGIFQRQLVSGTSSKPWDRIDRCLWWLIQICLVVLFLTLPQVVLGDVDTVKPSSDYFYACSSGDLETVQSLLTEHPSWTNARTDNGEACLHLTGIYGYPAVTEYLLLHGADPNIRSTYEQGLRMHPLSWNVYGGHVANVQLLLQHGADVNLDFDGMGSNTSKVTALDVVLELVKNEDGDDRFVRLEKLLRAHGGKTIGEMEAMSEQDL
eukprot:Nitzschia sp. Nitz4//scaffold98_size77359//13658//14296//NITZ4_005538-RA/size77359-processed-gene-0.32-mRNA-1//-1//CDS//3329560727//7607//frame0